MKGDEAIKFVAVSVVIFSFLSAGIFVYKAGKNKRIIFSHRNEYLQVILHLFDREIVENQLVGKVIDKLPSTKATSHDNYLTLQYFKTIEEQENSCIYYSYYIHIVARDNRLVKAFATEGLYSEIAHVFFNALNESSEDEYWESRMNNAVVIRNL